MGRIGHNWESHYNKFCCQNTTSCDNYDFDWKNAIFRTKNAFSFEITIFNSKTWFHWPLGDLLSVHWAQLGGLKHTTVHLSAHFSFWANNSPSVRTFLVLSEQQPICSHISRFGQTTSHLFANFSFWANNIPSVRTFLVLGRQQPIFVFQIPNWLSLLLRNLHYELVSQSPFV